MCAPLRRTHYCYSRHACKEKIIKIGKKKKCISRATENMEYALQYMSKQRRTQFWDSTEAPTPVKQHSVPMEGNRNGDIKMVQRLTTGRPPPGRSVGWWCSRDSEWIFCFVEIEMNGPTSANAIYMVKNVKNIKVGVFLVIPWRILATRLHSCFRLEIPSTLFPTLANQPLSMYRIFQYR